MKEVSAHFSSISRITGHHVDDLPSYLSHVLSPCHMQLALNMLRRVEAVAEAAAFRVSHFFVLLLKVAESLLSCMLVVLRVDSYSRLVTNPHRSFHVTFSFFSLHMLQRTALLTGAFPYIARQAACKYEQSRRQQRAESRLMVLQGNVRLLIDAEHSYMQPAIDAVVIHLQQKYNRQTPVVFNTYQCYLKDSQARVMADMQLAKQKGFLLAAKVVRGAYIHLERERAAEMRYPSPIHDTLEDTHKNYNRYAASSAYATILVMATKCTCCHHQYCRMGHLRLVQYLCMPDLRTILLLPEQDCMLMLLLANQQVKTALLCLAKLSWHSNMCCSR